MTFVLCHLQQYATNGSEIILASNMTDSESVDRPRSLEDISTRLSRRSSTGAPMRREGTLSQLSNAVRTISNQDAKYRCRTEEADNKVQPSNGSPCRSMHDTTVKKIISWEPNDKENPYNWSDVRNTTVDPPPHQPELNRPYPRDARSSLPLRPW